MEKKKHRTNGIRMVKNLFLFPPRIAEYRGGRDGREGLFRLIGALDNFEGQAAKLDDDEE